MLSSSHTKRQGANMNNNKFRLLIEARKPQPCEPAKTLSQHEILRFDANLVQTIKGWTAPPK